MILLLTSLANFAEPVAAQARAAATSTPATIAPDAIPAVGAPGVRLDRGRFTVVSDPRDARLAESLLKAALSRDTFPGLPRPQARVLIAIAPDALRFREWVGPYAPEWGAAIAMPNEQRIIMQGGRAGSDAGDPLVVLRHELAHLALHESMGDLPPRWFDEGYASNAAGEWNRERAFETSMGLVWNTLPSRDSLEAGFYAGAARASWSYAVAHRVVAELSVLDPQNGLRNFLDAWRDSRSMEVALRSAYGITGTQFDKHWHSRTRRQYGALALAANLSVVGGVFGLLLGPLFWQRRRRDRARLEAMRRADAAQEAALRASALDALLSQLDDPDAPTLVAPTESAAATEDVPNHEPFPKRSATDS